MIEKLRMRERSVIARADSRQTATTSSGKTYKDGTTKGASSGRRDQERNVQEIPRCTRLIGTVAIVEPDNQWWRELNLGSPEAILKVFVQQSGCFSIVNRGRAMQSRAMERAMADSGECSAARTWARARSRPPIIISSRTSSRPTAIRAAAASAARWAADRRLWRRGALGRPQHQEEGSQRHADRWSNARTTEESLTEGYARKTDIGFGGGAGGGWWGGFAAAGGGGYQNTEIGQVIVLAYLDAYTKLVTQLGGLPANAAAAAPAAR
jgi:hypothetical protein